MNGGCNYGIYNTGSGTIDCQNGNLQVNQTGGTQYGIYTDSPEDVNWENGTIFLNTSNSYGTQYAIYITGTGTLNIESIIFNNIGVSSGWINYYYSDQYFIYSKNTSETKNIININNFDREKTSTAGYITGITGSNVELNIENGHFFNFRLLNDGYDIHLESSIININGGRFDDMVQVYKSSTLTIEGSDTTIDEISNYSSIITINDGTIRYLYNSYDECNTIMNGGSIINSEEQAVELSGGTFTLLGGTIESTKGYGVYVNGGTFIMGNNENAVSIDEPSVKGSTNGVYRRSGTFNFYDGIITGASGAIAGDVNNKPENYKIKYNDGKTIATLELDREKESIVSVDGVYFNTMESAVDHANRTSGTILIHKDLPLDKQLTIQKGAEVTINLNAHSLTATVDGSLIINNGTLTIIDEPENVIGEVQEATIENKNGYVVTNNEILIIGRTGDEIDQVTPSLKGSPQAIDNHGIWHWYDGQIDDETTDVEKDQTAEGYVLASRIKANAENIIQGLQEAIQVVVQKPKIEVDKEWPIWTKDPVNATMYTTGRVELNIVNENENVEVRSIAVKKEWEMPDEEAENYMAVIQLMKIVDGKKVPVTDRQGKTYEVQIIGNGTDKFDDMPVSRGGKVIEYALEEIAIKKKVVTSEGEEWVEVPMSQFNVKYQKKKTE